MITNISPHRNTNKLTKQPSSRGHPHIRGGEEVETERRRSPGIPASSVGTSDPQQVLLIALLPIRM